MEIMTPDARPSGSLGKNIRRLRLERNLTQEELALRLNVTAQAVSKWENETGMPDISQIVPLASVFGTTTDVLFGLDGRAETEEAFRILTDAFRDIQPGKPETALAAYDKLLAGVAKYPGSIALLENCMSLGLSLVVSDNGRIDAGERAGRIAEECERQALSILSCARSGEAGADAVMHAREVLIFLYAERGDYARAEAEAWKFPTRSDFTCGSHLGWVNAKRERWNKAQENLSTDLSYVLQHIEDSAARLGQAYLADGRIDEAIGTYERIFDVLRAVYRDACPWPYHDFDSGDVHFLLAEAYLAKGDHDRAVACIEEAVRSAERLADEARKADDRSACGVGFDSPWLRMCAWGTDMRGAFGLEIARRKLTGKLNAPAMEPLRDDPRIAALVRQIEAWP